MELYELTVHELIEKLDKKEITSEDIIESYAKITVPKSKKKSYKKILVKRGLSKKAKIK